MSDNPDQNMKNGKFSSYFRILKNPDSDIVFEGLE
jgi:hypothetical protein